MFELDNIDEAIIAELQTDGRLSNREIARKLDLSETTIRKRLRRMEERKLVRLGVVSDMRSLGLKAGGFFRLAVTVGRLYEVAAIVAECEEAAFVAVSTGYFNMTSYLAAEDREALLRTTQRLLALDGVRGGDLMEPQGTIKHRYDVAVSSLIRS